MLFREPRKIAFNYTDLLLYDVSELLKYMYTRHCLKNVCKDFQGRYNKSGEK